MSRPPLHSEEKIIQTGKFLATTFDREVTATDIAKTLGGKGKLGRIRSIWEEHLATKDEKCPENAPLPDSIQEQIGASVAALQESLESIVRGQIERMAKQNTRQFMLRDQEFSMLEEEHEKKVQALEEEISYLSDYIERLETEKEITDAEPLSDAPAQPAVSETAPAAVVLAEARMSPNRPLKRTHQPLRKAAWSKPLPRKKSPAPTSSPS